MRQQRVRSIGRSGGGSEAPSRGARACLLAAGATAALGWSVVGSAWAQAPTQSAPLGSDLFAVPPETPEELWGAIDFLSRTGQGRQAVPYLEAFSNAKVDDAELLKLRDQFGPGSFLRLVDDPATRPFAEPLTAKLNAAARRRAADPERIQSYIPALLLSKEEQDYAVARLRESGSFAVPALVAEIDRFGPSAPERAQLVYNAGRLDTASVPAWIAVLDASDPHLATDAATILGHLGDRRAVPFLTFPAASPDSPGPVKAAATLAVERLTGRSFEKQPRSPVQTLDDAAEALARHQYELPSERVLIWRWDEARKAPAPYLAEKVDVEGIFGGKLAGQALLLEPTNRRAQVVHLGFLLERAVDKVGYENFPAQDQDTYARTLAAGPEILEDLLRGAIATGRTDLAAVTAEALGKVADPSLPAQGGRSHPLVEALTAPGRRLQLAAAKAIVDLAPKQPFPGSSRVVPTLSRFLLNRSSPRAVVIDGNPSRGSQIAGALRGLGYEAVVETTGEQGFQAATESADVELILTGHDTAAGSWNLLDVLSVVTSDARTASIPLYIYGPGDLDVRRPNLKREYPTTKQLIYTNDPAVLERQLGGRPSKLSEAERSAQATEAAETLARIASRPRSIFASDLASARETLAVAVGFRGVDGPVASTLGDVPSPDAQRALADAVLDGSRDVELRRTGAWSLARSIQRFGPLLAADQERKLVAAFNDEADPGLHSAIANVLGALRRPTKEAQLPPNATFGPPRRGEVGQPEWTPAENPAPVDALGVEPAVEVEAESALETEPAVETEVETTP